MAEVEEEEIFEASGFGEVGENRGQYWGRIRWDGGKDLSV